MKKRIIVHSKEILFFYLFVYYKDYVNRYVNDNGDTVFELDEYIFIFSPQLLEYDDVDLYLIFKEAAFPNHVINWRFKRLLDEGNNKIIVLDIEGEHRDEDTDKAAIEWRNIIEQNDNLYFISCRDYLEFNHPRHISKKYYLSIFFYYYFLEDKLFLFDDIPNIKNQLEYTKYDFVTHLGLTSMNHEPRYQFLDSIDFGNKSLYKPKLVDRVTELQEKISNFLSVKNLGKYAWYSLIEDKLSKIKLVFETTSIYEETLYDWFLTEKTMKCFLSSQPYFLIIHPHIKEHLKSIGFKFPEESNITSLIDYINTISKGDIDKWITENEDNYIHNKNHFKKLLKSKELPHIKIFEQLLNG